MLRFCGFGIPECPCVICHDLHRLFPHHCCRASTPQLSFFVTTYIVVAIAERGFIVFCAAARDFAALVLEACSAPSRARTLPTSAVMVARPPKRPRVSR